MELIKVFHDLFGGFCQLFGQLLTVSHVRILICVDGDGVVVSALTVDIADTVDNPLTVSVREPAVL